MLRQILTRFAAWLVTIAYNDEDVTHEVTDIDLDGADALDGRDLEVQGQGVPMENPHGLLDEFDGLD